MAIMKNMDVRQHAKASKIALWQIAKSLGVCDMTVSRMLREELPDDKKAVLLAIIDRLAAEEGSR